MSIMNLIKDKEKIIIYNMNEDIKKLYQLTFYGDKIFTFLDSFEEAIDFIKLEPAGNDEVKVEARFEISNNEKNDEDENNFAEEKIINEYPDALKIVYEKDFVIIELYEGRNYPYSDNFRNVINDLIKYGKKRIIIDAKDLYFTGDAFEGALLSGKVLNQKSGGFYIIWRPSEPMANMLKILKMYLAFNVIWDDVDFEQYLNTRKISLKKNDNIFDLILFGSFFTQESMDIIKSIINQIILKNDVILQIDVTNCLHKDSTEFFKIQKENEKIKIVWNFKGGSHYY